jgi:hypothetical protein
MFRGGPSWLRIGSYSAKLAASPGRNAPALHHAEASRPLKMLAFTIWHGPCVVNCDG